jgi:uncharacterized damage-inducible protein DinB
MLKELLLNYVTYNLWANKRLCGVIKELTPELWNKELKSSFKTIKLTLLHIWDAQLIWHLRLEGNSLTTWPSETFRGTNEELIEHLLKQSSLFIDYIKQKSDSELNQRCSFTDLRGNNHNIKISDILQHCMNHSTFHRGQLVTMLRELGVKKLIQTDYITYIRENNI